MLVNCKIKKDFFQKLRHYTAGQIVQFEDSTAKLLFNYVDVVSEETPSSPKVVENVEVNKNKGMTEPVKDKMVHKSKNKRGKSK